MMPAMCVPWPNGSPVTFGLVRHEVDPRDDASGERGVLGDAGVDDGDADAAARDGPASTRRPRSPLDPAQTLSARVTLLVIAMSATTGRSPEMCATPPSATQAVQVRVGEIERQGSGELAPEPPAEADAERCERALLRLHDHAHARAARQGRFQIFGNRRAPLSFGMSRRQRDRRTGRQRESSDASTHPLKTRAPVGDTGFRRTHEARSSPGLGHVVGVRELSL